MKYETTRVAGYRGEVIRRGTAASPTLYAIYARCSCGREGAAREVTIKLDGFLAADFIDEPPCDHWRVVK